jgi:acetyl esterase
MPLHPAISSMLALAAGRPALSAGTPDDARQLMASMRQAYGAGPDIARVENLQILTRSGSVKGRLYANTDAPQGLIVYFHGGGWVLGGLDDFDAFARVLARRSECALLLVDYRLAPESPFPSAIEDATDATRWAWSAIQALAGGPVPLVVAGDSAGGKLAAVVAAELGATLPIALQLLIYPVTSGDFETPSYREFATGLPLTREDMIWFFRHYAPYVERSDHLLHPAARADLSGLPLSHVVTAEYDVLRDEGEAYARALQQAGVPVTVRRYDGLTHGFIRLHNLVDAADAALSDMATVIAQACRNANPSAAANKERHA